MGAQAKGSKKHDRTGDDKVKLARLDVAGGTGDPADWLRTFPKPLNRHQRLSPGEGEVLEVEGTILRFQHQTTITPPGEAVPRRAREFADEVLFTTVNRSRDIDMVTGWTPLDQGEVPRDQPKYPVSRAFEKVINDLIFENGDGLVREVLLSAQRLGYHIYVVGGTIRDLVAGQATRWQQVNDLDLTGDMPPGLFADLCCATALSMWGRLCDNLGMVQRERIRMAWLPTFRISSSGVVRIYRPGSTKDDVKEALLEYAPLKQYPLQEEQSNINYGDQFVFGWDPEQDAKWRDMSINCLLYYPDLGGQPPRPYLLDPMDALKDFSGVSTKTIQYWDPGSVAPCTVALRPLPLPEQTTLWWRAKAIARLLKFIVKYEDGDLGPTIEWIGRHARELQKVQATGTSRMDSLEQQVRANAFKAAQGKTNLPRGTRDKVEEGLMRLLGKATDPALTEYAPAVEALVRLVREAIKPSSRTGSAHGAWPLDGSHALRLEKLPTGGYRVGSLLMDPEGDVDPPKYWNSATSGYAITKVAVEGVGDLYAFDSGEELLVPADDRHRLVSFDVEGDIRSKLRQDEGYDDLAMLHTFFLRGEDQIGAMAVSPDFEAPTDDDPKWAEWAELGWVKPKDFRTRPNPVRSDGETDKVFQESDMTEPMRQMEALKRMIKAGLVEVCEPYTDLFWACINGGSVRLTPLGRYYYEETEPGSAR